MGAGVRHLNPPLTVFIIRVLVVTCTIKVTWQIRWYSVFPALFQMLDRTPTLKSSAYRCAFSELDHYVSTTGCLKDLKYTLDRASPANCW
jgi:hypothetical protein